MELRGWAGSNEGFEAEQGRLAACTGGGPCGGQPGPQLQTGADDVCAGPGLGCPGWRQNSDMPALLQCRVAKFNNVHTLTLHIPDNFGAHHTTLTFIGIKGDLTEVGRLGLHATLHYQRGVTQVMAGHVKLLCAALALAGCLFPGTMNGLSMHPVQCMMQL